MVCANTRRKGKVYQNRNKEWTFNLKLAFAHMMVLLNSSFMVEGKNVSIFFTLVFFFIALNFCVEKNQFWNALP